MSRITTENNKITVSGWIVSEFEYNHEIFGEKFYIAQLSVERRSGTSDILPITVSDRMIDVSKEWAGQFVKVSGQFRSYNKHEGEKTRLILSIFALEFAVWEDDGTTRPIDENYIKLDGYICKSPIYRKTPLGREIADLVLAVNRPYGKSDYIPCICWGRDARFMAGRNIGTHIKLIGRLQSREYLKKYEDGTQETRTAYEVSASVVEKL